MDNEVGAAAATGDGDIMMRYAPSLRAVLNMKVSPPSRTQKRASVSEPRALSAPKVSRYLCGNAA